MIAWAAVVERQLAVHLAPPGSARNNSPWATHRCAPAPSPPQRYENAITDPTYGDLLLLAQALDIPVTDLPH
ncbi:hypothetical protein ABZZ79_13950 [Streptomyces sp. NPDC006458]|uniref:hypothetical protein n=1 Tax=Streptomyces sp. NPDC006458 TaxID=3154302 RepID=UPI0033A7300E